MASYFKKGALTLERSIKTRLELTLEIFTNSLLFTNLTQENYQKLAQVDLRRAPDSVINIFSKRDKSTLLVIIRNCVRKFRDSLLLIS